MSDTPATFLLKVLESGTASDDSLCEAARELLVRGEERAIEPIFRRLQANLDPSWVRDQLVMALGGLVASNDSVEREVYSGAEDLLLEILASPAEDRQVKASAVIGLGIMGSEKAILPLLEIIRSKSGDLQYPAVVALGQLRSHAAIPYLIGFLELDDTPLVIAATDALGKIGEQARSAIPTLERLIDEGNESERNAAKSALSRIN